MDRGLMTGAVFLDLSKSFDTVDHPILLIFTMLTNAGLTDPVVALISSYLSQRTQVTTVGNACSSAKPISVGVYYKGVYLVRFYFSFTRMTCLYSCTKSCQVYLYADDTVLYFSSSNLRELEENLNADLTCLCNQFNVNILTLNVDKCKFVIFGGARKISSLPIICR